MTIYSKLYKKKISGSNYLQIPLFSKRLQWGVARLQNANARIFGQLSHSPYTFLKHIKEQVILIPIRVFLVCVLLPDLTLPGNSRYTKPTKIAIQIEFVSEHQKPHLISTTPYTLLHGVSLSGIPLGLSNVIIKL